MFRKFSAVAFLLVMTMVVTLKHPVLGYCACLDSYFTGEFSCQTTCADTQTASVETPPSAPSCPNCSKKSQGSQEAKPGPCDDCTQHLSVDVGDFVWLSSDEIPDDSGALDPSSSVFAPASIELPAVAFYTPMSIRGDPPPGLLDDGIPLYLRHSVLRL